MYYLLGHDKLTCEVSSTWTKQFVYTGPKRKNVEVIQAEIVGHGDLYLCAVFLTVHDKLTYVKFHQPRTSSLSTLDLNANVNNGCRRHRRTGDNISWLPVLLLCIGELKKGALDLQPQVIKFTSCLPRVGGSLWVFWLPPPLKLVAMIQLKYC